MNNLSKHDRGQKEGKRVMKQKTGITGILSDRIGNGESPKACQKNVTIIFVLSIKIEKNIFFI